MKQTSKRNALFNPILILITSFSFFFQSSIACECYIRPISVYDYNNVDKIFVGRLIQENVTGYRTYSESREALYVVTYAYKSARVGDTIRVKDAYSEAACGLGTLYINREYLIYSYGSGITSDCGRTTLKPIQEWEKNGMQIEKMMKLKVFGRIYDTLSSNFHADTCFLNAHLPKTKLTKIDTYRNDNGTIIAIGGYLNGLPEGSWIYYNSKGKEEESGIYKQGKREGMWTITQWEDYVKVREYRNGEFTMLEHEYVNGVLSSKYEPIQGSKFWAYTSYYPDGSIAYLSMGLPPIRNARGELAGGPSNGQYKKYFPNGLVEIQGSYIDNEKSGHWKYYWKNSKKIWFEGDYTGGVRSGIWKYYYLNGKLKATGSYKNNQKSGVWVYYTEGGKLTKSAPDLSEEEKCE